MRSPVLGVAAPAAAAAVGLAAALRCTCCGARCICTAWFAEGTLHWLRCTLHWLRCTLHGLLRWALRLGRLTLGAPLLLCRALHIQRLLLALGIRRLRLLLTLGHGALLSIRLLLRLPCLGGFVGALLLPPPFGAAGPLLLEAGGVGLLLGLFPASLDARCFLPLLLLLLLLGLRRGLGLLARFGLRSALGNIRCFRDVWDAPVFPRCLDSLVRVSQGALADPPRLY